MRYVCCQMAKHVYHIESTVTLVIRLMKTKKKTLDTHDLIAISLSNTVSGISMRPSQKLGQL